MLTTKTCTVNKMTHLYVSGVLSSDPDDQSTNWHLWCRDMWGGFTAMTQSFLAHLTQWISIPDHPLLISSMSTDTRTPTLGQTEDTVSFPTCIANLYSGWESSSAEIF